MDKEVVHKVMRLFIPPPQIGERITVTGLEEMEVKVSGVQWVPEEARYKIFLNWGEHGSSHVFNTDEGKVWRRFLEVN